MAITATVALDPATVLLVEAELRHVLTLMSIPAAHVSGLSDASGRLTLLVDTPADSRLLIGPHGAHLEALEHVMRAVVRRRLLSPVSLTIDVNHYRAHRQQKLLAEVSEAAAQARRTGRAVVLPVMSATDRRAIHTALAADQSVRTGSVGEEPNRRVVIRPVFFTP